MGQEPSPHEAQTVDWRGTPRYEVLRCIGRGGMGAVYEVLDRERQQLVALKTLLHFGPAALYRFKQEFRTLVGVSHANLVRLYELVVRETGHAFFTMELVRGVHFLDYVRKPAFRSSASPETTTIVSQRRRRGDGEPAASGVAEVRSTPPQNRSPAELARLREAFRQLVEGIDALHAARKLHRDVKPSNVLVTREGRVVLLDFGVATELEDERDAALSSDELVGTARYMSPEQSTGDPQTTASDLYSAGVMLYEALAGRPPFEGPFADVISMKCRMTPVPPSACALGVPSDLEGLCMSLLDREPERRPGVAEILGLLGARRSAPPPPVVADTSSAFVGRAGELRALREAFEAARSDRQVTVRVAGAPGIGKSTVVERFLDDLVRSGQAVVLRGRAYERESVPYKAVDSAIDALSRHLLRLEESGEPLPLPVDIHALAALFPVLQRVPGVQPPNAASSDDAQGARRCALSALRDLLSSLEERQPLVVFVDDVHWGDVDSVALLAELTRPPGAPSLLLVMTYRDHEAAKSPFLSEMRAIWPASADVRDVAIGPLGADEAYRMALSRLMASDEAARQTAQAVVRESRGSPLLVEELVRHRCDASTDGVALGDVTLDQMVGERLGRLPEEARRLVEVVAVAGRPLPVATFAAAAGIDDDVDTMITLLEAQRFLRSGFRDGHEVIEPVHDRIRETIVATLPADILRERHSRLVSILDATPDADLEALALHMLGAGERERGARCAQRAGEEAASKLAFDQAARLFRLALETIAGIDDRERDEQHLRVRLAQVLERAGRTSDAADAYREAAERATAIDRIELETSAAEQLVFGGRIDEGAVALRGVLERVGIRTPRSALGAVFLLLFYQLWLRVVGLRFHERAREEIPREDLVRAAALRAVSQGLGSCEVILGACMQARHMLFAMRIGDPFQMLLALVGQLFQVAVAGKPETRRERAMLEMARDLALRCVPDDAAYFEGARGLAVYMRGHYREALELFDGIAPLARGSNRLGTAFARQYAIYSCFYLGRLREEAQRASRLLRDVEDRGDVYTIVSLRLTVMVDICLVADDPEGARAELRKGMAQWANKGFHLQHWFAMLSEAGIELYVGDGARAYARVVRDARSLRRSFLLHSGTVRAFTLYIRGCGAIASIEEGTDPALRLARVREARRLGRRLERERGAWGPPLAGIVLGAAANAAGDRAGAIDWLREASVRAERADMALHAWGVRYQLGSLLGGDEGRVLVAQAEQSMLAEGVRAPARMARFLVPGVGRRRSA